MKRRLAVRGAAVAGVVGIAELFFGLVLGFNRYDPWVAVAGTLIATGIGAVVGYLAFQGPGEVIDDVGTAARTIAGGELRKRVAETGGPVGPLTHDFNTMATRLQQAFDETTAARARVEAVLAATADAMIAIAPDTTVRYLNPAAAELLRVDPARVTGRPFIESARDYELDALVRKAMAPPRSSESQVVNFGPGRTPLRAVAVPIIDGGEWSVLLMLNDLTEVVRVDAVRRDFVSNVSHELRTPLASARAMVETLEDDPDATFDERAEFLGRVKQQIDRMTDLVNELLDLSRIESGALELRPEEIDLHDVVQEAAGLVQHTLEPAGMQVDIPDQRHVIVEADRAAILRICSNLLDNAAKHGGAGTTIHVDFRDDGELVALVVRDEGPGISPPELTRIFERFYKAEASRSSGGTGLGLAIVKHLVRAHGGTVEAESPSGGGAIFTVKLPRRFVGHRPEPPMTARAVRAGR